MIRMNRLGIRTLSHLLKHTGPITEPNLDGDRVTADACYPYLSFHIDFMLQLLGIRDAPDYHSVEATPQCPVFFAYGKRKPFPFHSLVRRGHETLGLGLRICPDQQKASDA